jgi:hypothetical protein
VIHSQRGTVGWYRQTVNLFSQERRRFDSYSGSNRGRTPRRLIYLRKRIFGLTKHTEILIDWDSESFSVGSMNLCRDVLLVAKLPVSEQRSLTLAHNWIGSLMAKLQGTASWEFESPSIHKQQLPSGMGVLASLRGCWEIARLRKGCL